MIRRRPADHASGRCRQAGRGTSAAGACAATLVLLLVAACFSLDQPSRRVELETLLLEPELLVVVDPRASLAFVTAGRALSFSTGLDAGQALRAEFGLPSPAPGFAEAFVAALREKPRFASSRFRVIDLGEAEAVLRERGAGQVFYLHTGEWRLYYDLSLDHYVMKVWLNAQIEPAAQIVTGGGTYALPGRLWKASCTFRGPEKAETLEAWRAESGALLHQVLAKAQQRCGRKSAELFVEFLGGGEPQGAFDFGDLPKGPGLR
jgi:hypothetical protein